MTSVSPFHKHIEAMLRQQVEAALAKSVPLPLERQDAIQQAMRLRAAGLPYASIAVVMREYHGRAVTPEHWSRLCREAGAPRKAPSGQASENSGKRWP